MFKILTDSGFDSDSSLSELNSACITDIENYINDNKNILTDTEYNNIALENKVFKLKPGHKAAILRLPKLLVQKTTERKAKENTKKQATNNLTDEQQIKSKLIKKIPKFAGNLDPDIVFEESSILDFNSDGGKISCKFECPICASKIKCTHIKYWLVSNFEAHLKKHFDIETVILDAPTTNKSGTVLSYIDGNSSELNEILDS